MTNLLTLPFKTTQAIPLKNAVRNYIQREHTETHPDAFKWDLNKWESLRKEAITNVVHISNVDKIIAYHAQLTYIATKLPPDIDLPIPYSRPFLPNPNPPMLTMSNLVYERISILYNLAALYCNLAVVEDRSNGDGIKRSLANFQNASGVLSYIVSVLPALIESLPPNSSLPFDLSEAFHNVLQYLMLAQAQELFWQRAVLEDVKVALISKLAAKTASYYQRTLEAMDDPQMPTLFSRDWITHVRIKHHHFAAAALYRKSIDDLGGNRYGEEIARLEMARVETRRGLDAARKGNVAKAVLEDTKSLSTVVEASLKRAERDNDLIYHQDVPSTASLPAIQDMKDVIFASIPAGLSDPKLVVGEGNVILGELSGWGVLKAIDIYNTRKNDWLQSEIIQVAKDLDNIAETTLQALNLPASLDALDRPIGLPPSLLRKAEQVRLEDAMNRIPRLLDDLETLSGQNRAALDEALDILDQEASEDEEMRAAYEGDIWTRPTSYDANTHLTDAARRYRDTLDNIDNTSRELRDTWDIWSKNIEPLCWTTEELERAVPSSTISTGSASGGSRSTQGHARALRSFLETLEDIIQSRTELVRRVQRIVNTDDVSGRFKREEASLARWTEVRPEVFDQAIEEELGKFDRYKEDLEQDQRRQDEALSGIKEKNALFLASRKEDPSVKARESGLQTLDIAYHKYRELCNDLAEGIKLHNDLNTLIADLENACKAWVLERRKDVEWLTAALNATSLTASTERQDTHEPVSPNKATHSTVSRQQSPSNIPPPDSRAWESISPHKVSRDSDSSRVYSIRKETKTEAARPPPEDRSTPDDFALDLPPPNSSAWESISPPLPPPSPSKKKTRKLVR